MLTIGERHRRVQRPPLPANDWILPIVLSANTLPATCEAAWPSIDSVRAFQTRQDHWDRDQCRITHVHLVHPLFRRVANYSTSHRHQHELCRTNRTGDSILCFGGLDHWW